MRSPVRIWVVAPKRPLNSAVFLFFVHKFQNDLLPFCKPLSAGRKGNGYVYFEVPADAALVEAEYEYDWWNDGKIIFAAEF